MNHAVPLLATTLLLTTGAFVGCQDRESKPNPSAAQPSPSSPLISDGGRLIRINWSSTDQILSVPVERRKITTELKAPCRIVLSAAASAGGGPPALLFESTDLSETISDYTKTKAQLKKSTKQTERLRALVAHQAAAGKDLLDSETELSQLKSSLAAMESKLRLTGLDIEHSLALPAGQVLLVADIPESQLGSVHRGSKAHIVFNSYPNEQFVSNVAAVGNVVDPMTRSIKVQVALPNNEGRLLPGMYGRMLLGVDEQSTAAVPTTSIFTALGKSFLFVEKRGGEFERREVLIGVQGADWVEILQGVDIGERVVSKGSMLLKSLSFGY